MADRSAIEWTDATWNPVRGCSRVSAGCDNCYAMRQAHRSDVPGGAYEGLTLVRRGRVDWTGKARLVPELLGDPLRWQRARRIFVNSMSDLFHESLPRQHVAAVFGAMALACHHTYQVLTKRPARMAELVRSLSLDECLDALLPFDVPAVPPNVSRATLAELPPGSPFRPESRAPLWPLPNVWLGVSAEDQATADERIPLLLTAPAALRFVSLEPLLGRVSVDAWIGAGACLADTGLGRRPPWLDWVILGGESGPGARPCELAWLRALVGECSAARVPCFVKQLGARPQGGAAVKPWIVLNDRKGGDPQEWPSDLRFREFPMVAKNTNRGEAPA